MKRILLVVILTSIVLFAFSALAQDKVVVIPMGSSSGDSWMRVYDDNGLFIGFSTLPSFPVLPPVWYPIVSTKNYFSILYMSIPDKMFYWPISTTYHLTSDCTGPKYYPTASLLDKFGNGYVMDLITSASYDANAYYIQNSTTPVIVPAGDTYYTQSYSSPCTGTTSTGDLYFYELNPNDTNVTGYQGSNLYQVPLKLQLNVPAAP